MSLVNDALRRAKEAQRQASPPPSPQMQFRPVEPAQHTGQGLGLMLPAVLVVAALLALLLIWQLAQGHKSVGPQEVRALTPATAQPTNAPQPAPTPVLRSSAAEGALVRRTSTGDGGLVLGSSTAEGGPPPVVATLVQESSSPKIPPVSDSATDVTNAVAVTAAIIPASPPAATEQEHDLIKSAPIPPPPAFKWPPLKLQAIVFNPKRPSVLINGRSLFVGEKLGDLRVVAIDRESATLVAAGQTNTLTMAE